MLDFIITSPLLYSLFTFKWFQGNFSVPACFTGLSSNIFQSLPFFSPVLLFHFSAQPAAVTPAGLDPGQEGQDYRREHLRQGQQARQVA